MTARLRAQYSLLLRNRVMTVETAPLTKGPNGPAEAALGRLPVETKGPPRFLGNPGAFMPCSLTPEGSPDLTLTARTMRPSSTDTLSAPSACFLSRL